MDKKKPAILSISFLAVMTNAAVAPMLGLISRSFPEAGKTLIKQVLTVPSLMIIIFSIVSGQLVRWLSKKVVLGVGLAVYMCGAVLSYGAGAINQLILFRAMMGAGAGIVAPLASSFITEFYSGKERAEMVGYSTFASYISAAVAPLLIGWFVSSRWQDAFYIFSISIVIFVLTMAFIPATSGSAEKKSETLSCLASESGAYSSAREASSAGASTSVSP